MKMLDMPPFAPVLMESTRAMGYSLESAIADIIDNSIAANASNVDIQFSPYDAVPFISILDNGDGMTKEQINDAMRYGSQSSLNIRDSKDLYKAALILMLQLLFVQFFYSGAHTVILAAPTEETVGGIGAALAAGELPAHWFFFRLRGIAGRIVDVEQPFLHTTPLSPMVLSQEGDAGKNGAKRHGNNRLTKKKATPI